MDNPYDPGDPVEDMNKIAEEMNKPPLEQDRTFVLSKPPKDGQVVLAMTKAGLEKFAQRCQDAAKTGYGPIFLFQDASERTAMFAGVNIAVIQDEETLEILERQVTAAHDEERKKNKKEGS